MSINIHVQEACVNVEVVRGEINMGKPPVLLELEVTKDGTYTPEAGVDGFSEVRVQVLPTDMLEGLEDGWDVMFYDEHKRGLASYSIKKEHTINPPVYNCKNWQNAEGTVIDFPYTPTSDVIFYALVSTYADQLYEFYKIDKAVYPYLAIGLWTDRTSCTLIFGKTLAWMYSSLGMRNGFWNGGSGISALAGVDRSDISAIVSTICQNLTKLTAATEMWGIKNQSDNIWYCNFDPSQFSNIQYDKVNALYRLDE